MVNISIPTFVVSSMESSTSSAQNLERVLKSCWTLNVQRLLSSTPSKGLVKVYWWGLSRAGDSSIILGMLDIRISESLRNYFETKVIVSPSCKFSLELFHYVFTSTTYNPFLRGIYTNRLVGHYYAFFIVTHMLLLRRDIYRFLLLLRGRPWTAFFTFQDW